MRSLSPLSRGLLATLVSALLLLGATGSARAEGKGFAVPRYIPTTAGEWSFWVDHPWYSSTRWFAAGLTLDYAHDPLVYGVRDGSSFTKTTAVIGNQLLGHVDLAGSFLDRVTVSASLAVTLLERGTPAGGVAPIGGVAVGDPRLGVMVRLWGQPDRDAFSISVGGLVWIPVGGNDHNSGDSGVRVLPKLVLAGYSHRVRWSGIAGFLYRPRASIGDLGTGPGSTVGSELHLGASVQYADKERRFAIGPEAMLTSTVVGGHFFQKSYSSLDLLLGAHYHIAKQVMLGLAGGAGFLRVPGSPDARVLLRVAYAPERAPKAKPLPPPPPADRDHDGVIDDDDLCPDVPRGERPDPDKLGCPMGDRDHDGVLDGDDPCPDEAPGAHPDPKRLGCPAIDTDGDGVYDPDDLCPSEPMGETPDPKRLGCPLADRDGDRVGDDVDACPDEPGAPDPDPKKNGCPGLVVIKGNQLVILQPVFFATNKDVILSKSYPVVEAVANALKAQSDLRIDIEGHTDSVGKHAKNVDLSQRRAKSVMRWLIEHGIAADRLESHGYGPDRPIADNKTADGRAANRRVEFHIVDK